MSESYDYVVIGAGSSGCAVAARLAEDSAARVLLVEAGGSNRRLDVKAPVAFAKQFHTPVDWDYFTEPEPHLNGRRIYSPRGKMLGGSSSMNAQIYIRGNRLDYDGWAEHGAEGWSYREVLPFFKRAENNAVFNDEFHATGGPLHVSKHTHLDPATSALIESAQSIGIPYNTDFNGERQDGVGPFQVNHHRGMRFSCAEAYLRHRPKNLTVRTKTLATHIELDRGQVTGVHLADERGRLTRVGVDSELILSGGAFNTPALLQLSGIGPADYLRGHGVVAAVDLPAVGENLMEHPLVYLTYELGGEEQGLFDAEDPSQLLAWLLLRRGKLTSNFAEAGAFLRTDPSLPAPDIELHMGAAYFYDHSPVGWDSPAVTIAPSLIASKSRGQVRIRSSDPFRKPAVTYNMLSEPSEVTALTEAVLRSRQIAAVAQERGVLKQEITPGSDRHARNDLEDWIRSTVQHTYHPACTARIGTPQDGVVDSQLRVHGVEGLRVADASVMPTVTRGNTHAPTVMIGERCADFIRAAAGSAAARPEVEKVA